MTNVESTTTDTADVAEQVAPAAPEKAPSKKAATQKKGAPKAKNPPKGAKAKAAAPKNKAKPAGRTRAQKGAPEARTNKKAEIIALMKRAKGVTLAEIMEATGWQRHTVRGFVSLLGSKGGEKIESSKNAAGDRCYRIAK
jgi:hypothetical protein